MTTTKYWMIDTTGEFDDQLVEVDIPDPFEHSYEVIISDPFEYSYIAEQQPPQPSPQGDKDAKLV